MKVFELDLPDVDNLIERVLRLPFAQHLNGCGFEDSWNSLRAMPSFCLRVWHDRALLTRDGREEKLEGQPLELLEDLLREYSPVQVDQPSNHNGPGWGIFTSYDLGFWIEPSTGSAQANGPDFPLIVAAFYPWALVPSTDGGWSMQVLAESSEEAEEIHGNVLAKLLELDVAGEKASIDGCEIEALWSRKEYDQAFASVKKAIQEGEVYQANLTQRHLMQQACDPKRLYKRLSHVSPAPYSCYVDCGDGRVIVSSSPELLYRVRDRVIETRPIKGTRRVVAEDEALDHAMRDELVASEKDRAELVMIVDLERNDLGRVCEAGSVEVPDLCRLESYAQVHHLVSTVRGRLRDGVGFVDLLRAGFPGGSITGAPKIRAMQLLRELEPHARGPYTGSVFALGLDGSIESNILIRTILVEPKCVSFNVGGGIVWDSQCDAEYEECDTKARGMLDALENRKGSA